MNPIDYVKTARYYSSIYDRFLPKDRNARILDLGCGGGHFLYYLRWNGYENCVGVDRDPDLVATVRRHVTHSIVEEDVFHFLQSRRSETWTSIALNDVLEHMTKSKALQLLRLVRHNLEENGRVMIKTINMSSPFGLRARYADLTHEQGFTEESIAQLVEAAQLEPIYIGPADSGVPNGIQRLLMVPLGTLFGSSIPRIVTANLICVGAKRMRIVH